MDNYKGYIHLYTGNGKGKTTAALGLAIRAVGAGKKVFIAQFVKGMHYSELDALKRFPEIVINQYGLDCFIINQPTEKDILAAHKGLNEVKKAIESHLYDVIVLDEICIALYYQLISLDDLKNVLKNHPKNVEIVLTGRYAPEELIEISDLVTEMKEIKHYFNNGIQARKGIDY
jgi:cob(I)alamin adenosyltransferase